MGKKSEAAEVAIKYTDLMVKCARNADFREKLLNPRNQEFIREQLEAIDMKIPDNAYVVVDKNSDYSKVFISNEDGQVVVSERLTAFDIVNNIPGGQPLKEVSKKELKDIVINIDEVVKKSNIVIVLPFIVLSDLEIKFQDNAEIILSTC